MHPTPAEIRAAIERKLAEDSERHPWEAFRENPFGGPEMPIPVRTANLIGEAITEACNSKGNQ